MSFSDPQQSQDLERGRSSRQKSAAVSRINEGGAEVSPYGPFKMILAGEGATGKTSLLERAKYGRFNESYSLTIGGDVVFLDLKVNNQNTRLMCWDSAGQTQFACIRRAFYRGMKGFIIVFDITWRGSFEAVPSWYYELKQTTPEAPFVLVGSKVDLEEDRQISQEEAQALATKLGAVAYIETSAKTGYKATTPFERLIEQIIIQQNANNQLEGVELERAELA